MKRTMGLFLALVMFIGCLSLNPIVSYANDGVKIDDAFPDSNFRKYVKDNFDKSPKDGYLSQGELDDVKKISITEKSVSSLEGIEYFTNLTDLYCYMNKLTKLDVSKNTKLVYLDCSYNKLTSLDVGKNINLNMLLCYENELTRLDVSKNKKLGTLNCKINPLTSLKLVRKEDATDSTYNIGLLLKPVKYTVKVEKGSKIIPFDKLPSGFDKSRIKSDVQLEKDGFTWDGLTNPIKFNYQLCENPNEVADPGIAITRAEITVIEVEFNKDNIEDMKVKEQPKLSYTEGDPLDLTGIVVTLTDNQSLERDVKFEEFGKYKINAAPENGTALTVADHDKNPVTLTKGGLKAETAKLTVNKVYTVTYTDGVDGQEIFKDYVTSGIISGTDTPKFNGTPSRDGYVFDKWSPDVAEKVTEDATYKATWKEDKNGDGTPDDQQEHFTVTYKDGVNGEAFQDQVKSNIVTGDVTPAFTGTPTRSGYVFDKWKPQVADTVTADATYTATWKEDKNGDGTPDDQQEHFTVTYKDGVNGEAFQDQVKSNIVTGDVTPAFTGTPTRSGYVFDKWTPDVAKKVIANATYVAQWQKDHFTVTFKDGDKTQTVKVETGKAIDTDVLTDQSMPKDPAKAGYTFKEWNTKEDGKGETFTGASVVNGDMTVYAIYTQDSAPTPIKTNSTVTFKDGDKTQTVKVETGKAIDTDVLIDQSMPKNPTKTGYTFKEWNTKEDGKGETFTGASVVKGDMTVYAIYTQDSAPTPNPTSNPPTPEHKPQSETPAPKSQSETPAPTPQPKKRIGVIPKTGESASFAGLLAALGFSIAGLAILRKKKMLEENNK